ncbi:MAG TPA: ATP synthase F1 subunit epsilon [Candidatus Saccharibacteria bacterium]|nr:ATP synthase F1 subunit epsilon [Candidatus Saccharibacteria bacterium]
MITFQLVTLDGVKYADEAYEVLLPTPDGIIAVFKDHMPLISIASPGVISVRRKSNEPDDMMENYATNGGVIEVLNNEVRVLADEADHADEINAAEAEKAIADARQLRAEAKDQLSLDTAQNLIDRSQTRLRVAELKRRRKTRR